MFNATTFKKACREWSQFGFHSTGCLFVILYIGVLRGMHAPGESPERRTTSLAQCNTALLHMVYSILWDYNLCASACDVPNSGKEGWGFGFMKPRFRLTLHCAMCTFDNRLEKTFLSFLLLIRMNATNFCYLSPSRSGIAPSSCCFFFQQGIPYDASHQYSNPGIT